MIEEADDKDLMVITVDWMEKSYDALNSKFFSGLLPPCLFGVFKTGKGSQGRRLGFFKLTSNELYYIKSTGRYIKLIRPNFSKEYRYVTKENFFIDCRPKIQMNGNYKWTEKSALMTMLHEMCHYYVCYSTCSKPKQSHGAEFRRIAEYVTRKSNGAFTIKRLSNAGDVEIKLDPAVSDKTHARLDHRLSNVTVVIIFRTDGIRLSYAGNNIILSTILNYEESKKECKKIICTKDNGIKHFLYNDGYKIIPRQYRYWNITNEKFLKELDYSKFETLFER